MLAGRHRPWPRWDVVSADRDRHGEHSCVSIPCVKMSLMQAPIGQARQQPGSP
jgi:hypothetical protein